MFQKNGLTTVQSQKMNDKQKSKRKSIENLIKLQWQNYTYNKIKKIKQNMNIFWFQLFLTQNNLEKSKQKIMKNKKLEKNQFQKLRKILQALESFTKIHLDSKNTQKSTKNISKAKSAPNQTKKNSLQKPKTRKNCTNLQKFTILTYQAVLVKINLKKTTTKTKIK